LKNGSALGFPAIRRQSGLANLNLAPQAVPQVTARFGAELAMWVKRLADDQTGQ
jgi:hypothetical protein